MASTRRFPGAAPSPSPIPRASRRDRVIIGSCIVVVTALAWIYLVHLNRQMSSAIAADPMASMGMAMTGPWGTRDFFVTFVMWAVMMVGMMTVTATPVLLLLAGARPGGAVAAPVLSFALGYAAVWLAFSAGAALAQWALHEAALLSATMATSNPRLAGAILIAAGAYQLTPFKVGCLTQCQSPLGFLMSNWRDGASGALRMGLRHGAYCLGCCWVLMGVLFAVGVMNLGWVGLLTAFILVEKIGPTGARLARVGGAILIAFGVVVASR